jgi:hypothetical protein
VLTITVPLSSADPDLAVAKGASLYAAGQTVRFVDKDAAGGDQAADDSGPGERVISSTRY